MAALSDAKSIHLTITDAYAKSWGTWEGVREFIQNWYDGVLDSYEMISPIPNNRKKLLIERVSTTCNIDIVFVLQLTIYM